MAKMVLACVIVVIVGSIGYRRDRALITGVAMALMLTLAADRFMPRPELPSFILLVSVLALLDRFTRRPDAWVYGIVGLQLVWVNLHGLFALGLALCGIYLAAEVLRPIVIPNAAIRWDAAKRLAGVTVLAALASLVNPNFVDGALYPIQQLGMIGPPEDRGVFGSLISELIPPISENSATQGLSAFTFGGWGRSPSSRWRSTGAGSTPPIRSSGWHSSTSRSARSGTSPSSHSSRPRSWCGT